MIQLTLGLLWELKDVRKDTGKITGTTHEFKEKGRQMVKIPPFLLMLQNMADVSNNVLANTEAQN